MMSWLRSKMPDAATDSPAGGPVLGAMRTALHRTKWMTWLDEIFDSDAVPEAAVVFRSSAHVSTFAKSTSEVF